MIIDGKQIKSSKTTDEIQALINDLGLETWDLTKACADLIDPTELIEGLLASIEHERKPLIERLKIALSG